MPAAVAVPLISAAVSGATSIVGAKMASNASKRAADTQVQAAARAERDTRQSTADALAYVERMRTGGMPTGSASQSYLSRLMGIPGASGPKMPTLAGASLDMRPSPIEKPYAYGALLPMAGAPTGQVMLRAPNGRQQMVPADQVDHYLGLGAVRVQ